MHMYLTYSKKEIEDASSKELQIVKDYSSNLRVHLDNIKRRILIDDNTLISIVAAINSGFNIILYGPPGTAKSTISEFLPVEMYGAKCNVHTADSEWNVRKVIGGITVSYDNSKGTPVEKIWPKDGYIVNDIMQCYESRLETTDFDTVFTVIDEFNRTNMDECLGPMFTAMGSDNKTLRLDYNKGFNDDFMEIPVPKGYRMICNMNKYDRTFTNELSDALSRRFKWIYVGAPDASKYIEEESIVEGNVFGSIGSILPIKPVNLEDIKPYIRSDFFINNIVKRIYEIINDLRADLEVGTSYKIDAVKLAYHFFSLKLALIDWTYFSGTDLIKTNAARTVVDAAVGIVDPVKNIEFIEKLKEIIKDIVDAAIVMTVIPACESLEDTEAIERNKLRFTDYSRCIAELDRMKLLF
ncbi:MAG: AAA domain-containing protein [Eubacteriaceae bacterium]|nr:AAA domain-containing protein [Eubacteriaceae bacterium]